MTELTLELAKQLTQDAESTEFTVDFDELWQWCGYTRKDNAKRVLDKNFDEGLDYEERFLPSEESDNHAGLSPQEKAATTRIIKVYTTPDCAKEFGMLAKTKQGQTVRRYFIQAEKELRSIQKNSELPQTYLEALKALVYTEEKRQLAEAESELFQGQLDQAEDTLDAYRAILSPEACLDFKQVADGLRIKKMGRNNLFKYLREKKFIVQEGTVPYRSRIEQEMAVVETVSVVIKDKEVSTQKTKLTFKGLEWLIKKLVEDGYEVNRTAKEVWDEYNAETTED